MLETDIRLHENPLFERIETAKGTSAQKKPEEEEDRHREQTALHLVRFKLLVIMPAVEQQEPTPSHNFEERKEHPLIRVIMLPFELIAAAAYAIA
jgi:hypothetical protein